MQTENQMIRRWNRPTDKNEALLEDMRLKLRALSREILDGLATAEPKDKWPPSLLDTLTQLQDRLESMTSQEVFRQRFYHRLRNLDNLARGRWGEFVARVFLQTAMKIPYHTVNHDRMIFKTPHGARRVDCFVATTKLHIEVKSAYINCRRRNLIQIQKDSHLLTTGSASTVVWILLGDGSPRIKHLLQRAGIDIILPSDSRLQPVYELFRLITLTDTPESDLLAAIDLLFEAGLPALITESLTDQGETGLLNKPLDPTAEAAADQRQR